MRHTTTEILEQVHNVTQVHTNKHFVYTGGDHGHGYVNYRGLATDGHYEIISNVTRHLLERLRAAGRIHDGQTVRILGPFTLGAMMASEAKMIGRISNNILLRANVIEKVLDGVKEKTFRWSPWQKPKKAGQSFVFMDDLLNAGTTFEAAKRLVSSVEGTITDIAVIGDRSGLSPKNLGVEHVEALERFTLDRHPAESCPYCAAKRPIVLHPGHGQKFQKTHPDYLGGFV